MIRAEIDAALAIGEAAQTLHNVVTRRTCKIGFGDPSNLGGEVGQELVRVVRAALGDVASNPPQVLDSEGGDDEAFRIDGLSLRS